MTLSAGFSPIMGKSVFLRKFVATDAEKVFQMSLEKGMRQWIPDQVYADLNESQNVLKFLMQLYDSGKGPAEVPIVFGICLKDNGKLIGHAGLSPAAGKVEIGYAVEDSRQRNGYAADAVAAISRWALDFYHLPEILGIVAAENIPSCKTLEKVGFSLSVEKEQILHEKIKMVRIYSFQTRQAGHI